VCILKFGGGGGLEKREMSCKELVVRYSVDRV